MLLFTISSMAEKPTIKSATARFIKRQKVFFKTHLNFQNTTIVIVLTTMIIKDSTAKITVQKINSSALRHREVSVFHYRAKKIQYSEFLNRTLDLSALD